MNELHTAVKDRFVRVFNEIKKLGLTILPGGGYTTGYNRDRVPPFPIGLFGALSLIEGENARARLGLSIRETLILEEAFNNQPKMDYRGNAKRITKQEQLTDLQMLGRDLRAMIVPRLKSRWDEPLVISLSTSLQDNNQEEA